MNTLKIHRESAHYSIYQVAALLLLVLLVLQYWIVNTNPADGFIGPSIWLLALIAFICFIVITALSWWLLQRFWLSLGLPQLDSMVKQFKSLTSWEQLILYWLCFASLLLAGAMCLMAVL